MPASIDVTEVTYVVREFEAGEPNRCGKDVKLV